MSTPNPTDNTNSLKRRRTDGTVNQEQDNKPLRSDVWFKDGNIILETENTQFKVHGSVLSKHSTIFEDVFAIPHPNDEPTVDGCPVVQLQDSAEDIRHMILTLYGDEKYITRDPIPFKAVAAMVRMGRKYDIKLLRDQALVRLKIDYPATVDDWLKDRTEILSEIIDYEGLHLDVANLAYENEINTILPSIYLTLACIGDMDTLMTGVKQSDGTISKLCSEVLRICILGREKLMRTQAADSFSWLNALGKNDGCEHPDLCGPLATIVRETLWKGAPPTLMAQLFLKRHEVEQPFYNGRICHVCVTSVAEDLERRKEEVMTDLPQFFGLPAWDALSDFGG